MDSVRQWRKLHLTAALKWKPLVQAGRWKRPNPEPCAVSGNLSIVLSSELGPS